ncbi:hypothetical protein D3C86_1846050 [compost metagenome]
MRLGARGIVIPDAQRQARVEIAVASTIASDEPVEQDFEEVAAQRTAPFALRPSAPSLIAGAIETHPALEIQTF